MQGIATRHVPFVFPVTSLQDITARVVNVQFEYRAAGCGGAMWPLLSRDPIRREQVLGIQSPVAKHPVERMRGAGRAPAVAGLPNASWVRAFFRAPGRRSDLETAVPAGPKIGERCRSAAGDCGCPARDQVVAALGGFVSHEARCGLALATAITVAAAAALICVTHRLQCLTPLPCWPSEAAIVGQKATGSNVVQSPVDGSNI